MNPPLPLNTLLSRLVMDGKIEDAEALARTAVEIRNLPTARRTWNA